MTQTDYRREFWQNVFIETIKNDKSKGVICKAFMHAECALQHLDRRFPTEKNKDTAGSPFFNLKEINEEAKLLTELLTAIGELKNIATPKKSLTPTEELADEILSVDNLYLKSLVNQYSAQLADYRKAGPVKDIEIERLTREGLIKDQKLKEALESCDILERQLCKESEDYEKRITELEKAGEGWKNEADRWRRTSKLFEEQTNVKIAEKDTLIAELEKQVEDLLAPAAAKETMQPTTVKEWLMLLDEPYRSQALKNAEDQNCSDAMLDNIADAIYMFGWGSTPEGWNYWQDLHKKYTPATPMTDDDLPF